jgi:hypothetical protein
VNPALIDTLLVGASLALYAVAYAGVLVATRPARIRPGPATPDLGEEPPAVVNLLANRWRLTEDASESTLLDLAARHHLELRQPGNDPRQTSVHLRPRDQAETLAPYERRVLDRVTTLAVDGMLPVGALTFRSARRAKRWNRRLQDEVVAGARARGLSRRRMSPSAVGALVTVAAVSGSGVALAVFRLALRDDNTEVPAAFWAGAIVFGLLAALAMRPLGERDTPQGREVAARWLGVQAWLRGHEEFVDLPPAAVMVWDRYLPYGAALGVTHTASEVLDLGLGDRRRVWSSYGGRWRRVRVRYPRLWPRYGASTPRLLLRGGLALALAAVGLNWSGAPQPELPAVPQDLAGAVETAAWVVSVLALLAAGYGGYVLLRTLLDLVTTRTVTGEVLWIEQWRSRFQGRGSSRRSVPWLDYLAVDDGRSDRTKAWGLPRGVAPGPVVDRDVVTVRVRPWSRRVVDVTVVERGRTHQLVDAPAADAAGTADAADAAGTAQLGAFGAVSTLLKAASAGIGGAGALVQELLTAEEVSRELGIAAAGPRRVPVPGPIATATFATADRGRQVLQISVASGRVGGGLLRIPARGTALPGVGDEAHVAGNRGAVRAGDTTVLLALTGEGRSRQDRLPRLLELAAARMKREREPA